MKSRPIDQIVYECMFPKPKATDPQNFQGLLQRQLVPEVRLETQAFYGHLSSQEAKYPGLDYSYQPHRNRLSRYPWHRRLFRAFDNLRLTNSEIATLTKWEGTRWAKERFEKEQGLVIRDTTSDRIADWVEPELRVPMAQGQRADVEDMADIREEDEREAENENEGDEDMDEDSDVEFSSVGIPMNQRMVTIAAQREAGEEGGVMDDEFEQWFKDAVEAGGLPFLSAPDDLLPNANIPSTRRASIQVTQAQAMPPRILNAARLGQWHMIPEFLHDLVRQNVENNTARQQDNGALPTGIPIPAPPRVLPWSATLAADSSASIPSPWASTVHELRAARRATSAASESNTIPRRLEPRLINRLDSHFAEQFSRRPVPPLPSLASNLSTARERLAPWQSQSGS